MIASIKIRFTGRVTEVEDKKCTEKFSLKNEETHHMRDLTLYINIKLK
jgi:hypothetical protein